MKNNKIPKKSSSKKSVYVLKKYIINNLLKESIKNTKLIPIKRKIDTNLYIKNTISKEKKISEPLKKKKRLNNNNNKLNMIEKNQSIQNKSKKINKKKTNKMIQKIIKNNINQKMNIKKKIKDNNHTHKKDNKHIQKKDNNHIQKKDNNHTHKKNNILDIFKKEKEKIKHKKIENK